eukprot:scaffold129949_cov66-Phaeocystis_antarctica.AAC.1
MYIIEHNNTDRPIIKYVYSTNPGLVQVAPPQLALQLDGLHRRRRVLLLLAQQLVGGVHVVVPALRDALPRALAAHPQLRQLGHEPLLELARLLVLGADPGLGGGGALEPRVPRQPLARLAPARVHNHHRAQ